VKSAKRAGVNPEACPRDVLAHIGDMSMSQLEDLLPDRWKQMQVPSAWQATEFARRRQARQIHARA
jgi:hypothetical protein